MHFLLTNDDGFDAQGLAALADAATTLGSTTWSAPVANWSVCAHRVTTDKPIRILSRGENRWAIEGTPADCVRIGLAKLAPGFDVALSGMNHGGNLGADVYHSGTVAAAREAALHGRAAIAISHYRKRGMDYDWSRAIRWMTLVLTHLLPQKLEPGTFWNVNLPNLRPDEPEPRIIVCPLDPGALPVSFREDGEHYHYDGNYHERSRQPGCDVAVCFGGDIAVSLLRVGF